MNKKHSSSDKVNEFLKELAPMKETKFWHEFIARLMMGGGGGGGGNKRIQPYYGTMNYFNHNHYGRYPKLSSDSGLKSAFAVANPQYNFNEKQYQQNLTRNKEFICSTITKDHHIVGIDDDDHEGLLVINPPVPVHIRMAKKYYSRIFSPPPPPPPTPPPTPPKPKFFKLFQPSIYTPSKAKRRKLSVVRILPPSTYHQQQQPPPPTQHQQQQLFVPEKFDSFKPVNIHQNQNQIFYDCHFDQNPRLNPTPPPTPQFPQLDPMIMMMMMGEETSTTDDTLTEDATITTIGGDSQTIASPAPEQQQQQPTEPEKELKSEPEQPEQEEVPPSQTGAVHKEEDNIQEVKSQPNKVMAPNVMVKDKPPKSPLQRSLSEPNAAAEKSPKAMSGLQKSPSRPIFTSSSFYDPNQHPTLEDQVKLCREIAKQLVSDDANAKSKGREMFERRVQKSARWITENDDSFQNYSKEKEDYHERTIDDGPPNLKLLLDPRHVEDINTVQGVNEHIIVTQEAKTRDCCKNIVNDLNSPEVNPNRGNALFAKRVQKSDEWIVDDVAETVIDAARDRLFRNVKQKNQSPSSMYQQWSTRSSPIPPPTFQQHPYQYHHQAQPQSQPQPQPQQQYNLSFYSRPQIPGPIFSPVSQSPMSSRPSSSMSLMSQFKDFNARPKPFCRAY